MKVGEVERVRWYILDDDRVISFHTASQAEEIIGTFYAEREQLPSAVARKLRLRYSFLRNATLEEEEACVKAKELRVKGTVVI